jgi:hypothetical protein
LKLKEEYAAKAYHGELRLASEPRPASELRPARTQRAKFPHLFLPSGAAALGGLVVNFLIRYAIHYLMVVQILVFGPLPALCSPLR